ncbi:MAG: sialate O-acetylesterase [Planctomycetes bacterium]|nr:sialate O-acetylesterase [Planctomycetota bacterium]
MKIARRIILVGLVALFVSLAVANVKLPAVFGDNMVLQQQSEVTIWGWADPGEEVTVSACWKASASTKTGNDGKWSVKIKTPKTGNGPHELTIKGNYTITLKNVLLGEVWVCSGQSNMQWGMNRSADPEKNIAKAKYPKIRLFTVQRTIAGEPQEDCKGNWAECSPETVAGFSAVGYYFGKHLFDEMDVPIGLISTNWGGTVAEAWTRREILEGDKDLKAMVDRFDAAKANFPEALKNYEVRIKAWEAKVAKAKTEGKKSNVRRPGKPRGRHQNSPSSLYNGMISPIIPFAIKGAIWYQGESNVSRAYQYRTLFPAMIANWRDDWKQGDFPFYYVQIAPFKYGRGASEELREAQMLTLSLKNTGMAVISDIGNIKNIHPKNKLDVGKRLALWALAKDYGKKDIVYSGPIYKSMKVEGDKIRLTFDYTGSGLKTMDGKEISHLTIAGEDKKFVEAKGVIDGNTVVVSSDAVKKPVSVRYGWSNTAEPNLANKNGLPASCFRTDDWPGVSYEAR